MVKPPFDISWHLGVMMKRDHEPLHYYGDFIYLFTEK